MKRVIDLSHPLSANMPVFPGDEIPSFELNKSLAKLDIYVTKMTITTHLGTHLDSPAHLGDRDIFTSDIPVEKCIGKATVVDVRDFIVNDEIQASFLNSKLLNFDFLILYTQTDKLWGTKAYFVNYPFFSKQLATALSISSLKGVGIDTANIDKSNCLEFSAHHHLLKREKIIIENLTNLEELINQEFLFIALPLKIELGDGSPVRAVAYIDN